MANDNAVVWDEQLMSELESDTTSVGAEFDPDADYNAPPPPLPDGWYLAHVTVLGVKDLNGRTLPSSPKRSWGNIPETYHTILQAKIIDPGGPSDGKYATDSTVTTHADPRRGNTSKVNAYYRAITGQPLPGVQQGAHMKALLDEIGPQGVTMAIKTQLEGQPPEASKRHSDAKKAAKAAGEPFTEKAPKTYRGDKAFYENGKLTGRVTDPETGEIVVGRPVIVDVKNKSFIR